MKLSTLYITSGIQLVAERFVRSNNSVELLLQVLDNKKVVLEVQGAVCQIAYSAEAKNMQYFRAIEANISRLADSLIEKIEGHDSLKGVYLDSRGIVTFILGGIFDSY